MRSPPPPIRWAAHHRLGAAPLPHHHDYHDHLAHPPRPSWPPRVLIAAPNVPPAAPQSGRHLPSPVSPVPRVLSAADVGARRQFTPLALDGPGVASPSDRLPCTGRNNVGGSSASGSPNKPFYAAWPLGTQPANNIDVMGRGLLSPLGTQPLVHWPSVAAHARRTPKRLDMPCSPWSHGAVEPCCRAPMLRSLPRRDGRGCRGGGGGAAILMPADRQP